MPRLRMMQLREAPAAENPGPFTLDRTLYLAVSDREIASEDWPLSIPIRCQNILKGTPVYATNVPAFCHLLVSTAVENYGYTPAETRYGLQKATWVLGALVAHVLPLRVLAALPKKDQQLLMRRAWAIFARDFPDGSET